MITQIHGYYPVSEKVLNKWNPPGTNWIVIMGNLVNLKHIL